MNSVNLIGRLTKDVTVKETGRGTAYANITLAIDSFSAEGEKTADFINCTVWGNTAENVGKYCKKGDKIAVEGSLKQNVFVDKKHEDVTHYETYVSVSRVEFLQPKEKEEEKPSQSRYNRTGRK